MYLIPNGNLKLVAFFSAYVWRLVYWVNSFILLAACKQLYNIPQMDGIRNWLVKDGEFAMSYCGSREFGRIAVVASKVWDVCFSFFISVIFAIVSYEVAARSNNQDQAYILWQLTVTL